MNRLKECYGLLSRVFRDGAYSSIELDKTLRELPESDRAFVTKLFYGVLEKNIRLDYAIDALTEKRPQAAVRLLLKIGLYMAEYMRAPEYAAVSETVRLAKSIGKSGAAGFINAVLRNRGRVVYPDRDSENYLSITYGYPQWLVRLLTTDYGCEETEKIIAYRPTEDIHIRVNLSRISEAGFAEKYRDLPLQATKYGYYVKHSTLKSISTVDYVVQSLASAVAVHAYTCLCDRPKRILDVCAAPGGKSVYLKQLFPDAEITACDLHEHRLSLLRQYASSCGVRLDIFRNDAAVFNPAWRGRFDLVVCDVPCSGIGVVGSKPDILLNRTPEDIEKLAACQSRICEVSSEYVAPGGLLCYSTCTVLKKENDEVVNGFLKNRDEFKLCPAEGGEGNGFLRLFPYRDGTDGFFVARMRRGK